MSYIAEQSIIGALLLNPDCISEVYSVLEPQMFTSELFGKIYHEFQRAYDNHYDINPSMLEQRLRSDSFPSDLIMSEIKACLSNVATSVTIKTDANVVVSDYKADRLSKFINAIKVTPNNYKEQIRALQEELEVLENQRQAKSKSLSEIAKEYKGEYFKEREIKPLYLGFSKLDDMLGGLEKGDVTVIGARPGVGKSSFVTQVTSYLAKQGKRVGFYNLEMKEKQMYERFIVNESGISLTRLKRAIKFLGDEKEKFDKANQVLEANQNIIITSEGGKSISEIRSESRHMDYDIIIIDYLQLILPDVTYRGNRTAEVGAISKAIKRLAMDLNIPIIVLSQLNRLSEGRETREPSMSELRESGDIEQDASVIILLWNTDNDDDSKKGCKVAKNRQGTAGKVAMRFNGDLMRFEETDSDISSDVSWKSSTDNPFG